MLNIKLRQRVRCSLVALVATTLMAVGAVALSAPAEADGHHVVDSIHFLIPGGAGGGWDGTARGTGEALTNAGLVGTASYENMSGGGGGKAIGYLIENADSNHGTLMVNSTPIVIRSLTGVFPHNFRDLTLVAGTIGDYAAIVVPADSALNSMDDLLAAFDADPQWHCHWRWLGAWRYGSSRRGNGYGSRWQGCTGSEIHSLRRRRQSHGGSAVG